MSEYGNDANITGSLIVDGETDIGSGDDDIDMDAGTLFIDATNNRVGIGTESPEAYLDIKNTIDDGATNRTMIQMYNYRADDADENDWAPTSIDFKIENVAGGVKGATARIATVIAPVGTNHNTTSGERSSALIFSTMDDNTLAEAMRIDNHGNVGIGTSPHSTTVRLEVSGGQTYLATDKYASPALHVTNDGDNQYRYGMTIKAGTDDGTCTRGVIFRDVSGGELGYINWTIGVVAFASFTGAHQASVPSGEYTRGEDTYAYGTIVKIVATTPGDYPKQVKYEVTATTEAEDKAVLGIYSSNMDPDETQHANTQHQIFSLGDGHVLVCDEGADIEIGDYICSSNTSGHGKKQGSNVLQNYTVAKATEAVTWSSESATTKLISCTYHAS